METQIIPTENPNVVIERTIIDKPIDLGVLAIEIEALQQRINSLNLIEVPEGVDEEVIKVINEKNAFIIANDITPLQNELEQKQQILNNLQNG